MPDLRTVLADLCRRAGLDAAAIDLSVVEGRLDGLTIASRRPVRGVIEALQRGFFLDVVESDGVLRFRPRGGEPAVALAEADLVPLRGRPGGALLATTRTQPAELPVQVDVMYLARAADWQPCTQTARRAIAADGGMVTVELPLALADDQARQIADALLYEAWSGRDRFALQVSRAFAWLDPGDVVTVAVRGVSRRLRIVKTELGGQLLRIEAVADDPAAYHSAARGGSPAMAATVAREIAPTVAFLLDVPGLRDQDDDAGFYVAASYDGDGSGQRWRGAVLYRSGDGTAFEAVADLAGPAVWGICQTALPDGRSVGWDEASRVDVAMHRGSLAGVTARAVLDGANAAWIGGEIVQFRNAALIGPGRYELSGLLRGRRGTEHRTAGHAAGEAVVLLRGADLVRVGAERALLNLARWYKAVSYGLSQDNQAAIGFTNTGAGLRPYRVAHLRGRRDASGSLTITWVRRSRIGGAWIDGTDVPLAEEREAYEVEVLAADGTVRRLIAGLDTPSASYGSASQSADFGAPQASLRVRVFQISAAVGRGVGREAML